MATLFDIYGLSTPDDAERPANRLSYSVAGGLKRSFAELPEIGAGVLAYGADAVGATDTRDKLLGYVKRKQADIASAYPAASFSDVVEGKTSPVDFLADATGYVAGQAAQALASGGLTALGFKTMAKTAAMQAAKVATERAAAAGIAREAARQVGLDAAETVLTRALRSGAVTGAGVHNIGMELGSIYPEAVEEAHRQGRELDGGDNLRIGLSALAAAAVDTAMEAVNVGRVMKGAEGASFAGRAAREIPLGMAREGSTEAIQTGIEHYGAGQPIADEKGLRDIIDSAAVGAVGGGLAGGGASLHRRAPAVESTPPGLADQPPASAFDMPVPVPAPAASGMQRLATGTTIDEVIAGAHEVADVPLTGGLSAGQEARALDALDRQAQRDMDAIRQAGRAMSLDEQRRGPAPPPAVQPSASVLDEAPFGDRVLTLREQLADPNIRDQLRALDPQAFSLVSQYAGIADRPDINLPEKTRDRLLGLAELIVSRAVAQPLETAQPGPSATRVAAGPALTQPAGVPRLELDTTPTGAIRVDSSGSAAPETRADAISTKQRVDAMRKRPDGFDQQVQGRPLPRDFTLVGDGTLTPGTMPMRDPAQLPAPPNMPGKRGAFEAAERERAAAAARKPDELEAIAAVKRASEAPAPTALGAAMRTAIDRQAHEAATSPANAKAEPTEAQKKAGNYQLGHIRISGLDISVENPAGSTRSGVDKSGKPWSTTMTTHYGYFKRTRGADGDHVDVFVKPGTDSDFDGPVFIVDQVDPETRAHDEHKVVLGAKTREEAEAIYRANYAPDWHGLGAMTRMSLDRFKEWLANGDTTKPVASDLQRRVEASRRAPAGVTGERSDLLPKSKLAELAKLTQRSREDVATQYTGFVQKHGQAKADQMLERALQVARENPKRPPSEPAAAAVPAETPKPHAPTEAAEPAPQPQQEGAPTEATGEAAPASVKPAADRTAKRVRSRMVQQEVDLGLARVRELRAAGRITAADAMAAISSARDASDPADAAAKLAEFLREKDRAPVPDAEPPRQAEATRPRRPSAGPSTDAASLRQRLDRHHALAAELNAGRSMTTSLGRIDLTADDRGAIMRRAAELRAELARTVKTGVASAAAKQAVAERIEALRAELGEVDPSAAEEPASEPPGPPETTTGAAAPKIEDAGEKIGGARKDRWAERGLDVSDLDAMAEGEGAELATKANVWKPDYQAIAVQAEPVTAAMVKVVYDSLAAKPRQNTPQGRRDYVRAMQAVRKVYGAVKSVQEAKDAYQQLRAELGIPAVRMGLSEQSEDQKAARRALFSVYKGRSDPFVFGYNELQRAKALVQDGFPGAIEPWTRRFVIREWGGAGVTDRGLELIQRDAAAAGTPLTAEQIRAGYFEVRDKAGRTQAYLPTKADAEQAAKALYEATKGKGSEKTEPERPHLDKIAREGMEPAIDRDATPQDLLDTFGFRGVEWGNWSAQDERQRILNLAYDALSDLAKIMNVPRKALSLNGTLGMAFGARGGGRFAAHYEPGKLVINMTKLRGAGSLAHEWAHALDHYLGELERSDAYQGKARGASGWYGQRAYTGRDAPANLRPELAKAIDQVMRRLFEGTIDKATMLAELQAQRERTQALAARETDSKLKAVYTDSLAQQQRRIDEVKAAPEGTTYPRGKSDYAKEAQKLSGKSADGYWLRPTEMWARAFESYVFDRLMAMGAKSEYLVHGVEQDRFDDASRFKGNPYPKGDERAAINKAFDAFVSELKTREDGEGRVALFSRAAGDEANALRALSENDELFALPKSKAMTVEGIAADIDPEIKVTPRKIPGETRYDLTMPDGKTARLIVRKPNPYGPTLYGFDQVDGEMSNVFEGRPGENPEAVPAAKEDVYVDASLLESGGGGAKVYQIAATFAHNTGRIFIGDPAGLSDEALRRRTEQMLSSALKFGTTEHLAPHPRQTVGDKALGVPPLKWVYGDDLGNIRRMVEVNLKALENAGYGDSVISFDPGAGRFRDSGGEFLSRADIDALAKEAGLGRRGQAGGSTLARGAVLRALLREEGREGAGGRGRDGLLARLAGLGGDAAAAAQGIFYSRDPEAVRGLSRAEAEAVLALPQALINRLLGQRLTLAQLRDVASRADGLDIQVAQSVDDLPPEQRKKLSARVPNGNVRGVYFPDIDRIWLIADHLHSEAEASFVLLHEAFHRGLAKTFGADARRVLRQMYHTNGKLQKLTKEQMQAHGIGQDEAIEEALADLAGRGEARDLKGWDRLVQIIRAWLDNIGHALGFTLKWTDAMIEDFVAGTARAGMQGGVHVSVDPAARASKEGSPAAIWVDATVRAEGLDPTSIRSAGDALSLAEQIDRTNRAGPAEPAMSRAGSRQAGDDDARGPISAQDLVNARGGVFDFNRLGATQQDRVRTVVDGGRSFWLGALTRDQLADIYGREMPQVKDYDALTRAMENERSKIAQDADGLYNEWAKLDSDANDKLARVMLDATVHSVHPDGEFTTIKGNDAATEDDRRKVHKRLRREFAELPDAAQAMYRKVRDFHAGMLEQLKAGLEHRIERQVQDGKARAATLTSIRQAFDRYKEHGPYFPLSRFGDFLVIGTREDGERVVASYETAGEQATAARALRQDGFTVKMKTAKQYTRALDGSAGRFAGDVLALLNGLDMSEATLGGKAADLKTKLLDDVNQLFIRALPDLSYRRQFAHRQNTPGFSADVMRGFASSAFHGASHIARLNYADRMSFALEDAYRAIERADDGDFNKHTQVLNELALRHDAAMNPNTHPFAALLNQVGFVMYLGASPAAGLVNLLQTPMITLPYLGARHGFGKAAAGLAKATKDILAAKASRQSGWNAVDSPKLSEAERETMRKLQDEGVIDLTQAHDLSAATGLDTGNVARSKAAFAMSRAMKIVGWTFHVPEVMNRQATALAAYRLEMEASGDQAKAEDAAREAIKRTHFDYSSSNRARYMQGNLARVVLQFKQYAQNMTYLLGRAAYQALKDEDPAVRRVARRQLVATLGATFAMAGALGLPAVGVIGQLVGALVGALDDDDKPWDWKAELRNLFADTFGKEAGEVLAHGLPRALMPWDVANRVGMSDLWFRSNDREGQSPREAFANDMANILGPSAGTLLGWYTAADQMALGNWSKAAEAITPKFVRDVLQAGRMATEGVTSYKGEHVMDLTPAESLGKLLGFTPARVSETYEAMATVKNAETAVLDRRKLLIGKAARARMEGDGEAAAEAAAEIAEFNRRNPAERIKGEAIVASVLARRRHERETADGVSLPPGRDHFREVGRFAVTQ